MENSWNRSRRIFLHVGCDVASFFLPSKALLYCYLCLASSLFPARAGACEKLFQLPRASGCVWHQEPRCTLWGEGREGKPACFGFPKGLTGQNSSARLSPRTQSNHGENNCSFVNHYKILRSGLELAGCCSFFALLSATSVCAQSKAFGNSDFD